MLGVGLILAIGVTLMLAAMLLEPILAGLFKLHWFQKNPKLRYAYAEWKAGSTLQIQRLANESLGVGNWSTTAGTVPVTAPGDALAILDISEYKHPRLVPPYVEPARASYSREPNETRSSVRYAKIASTEPL